MSRLKMTVEIDITDWIDDLVSRKELIDCYAGEGGGVLLLEDSGILDGLKEGVGINVVSPLSDTEK